MGSVRCGCAPPPPPPHPDSSVTHHRPYATTSPVAFIKMYRALAIFDAIERVIAGTLPASLVGSSGRIVARRRRMRQRRARGAETAIFAFLNVLEVDAIEQKSQEKPEIRTKHSSRIGAQVCSSVLYELKNKTIFSVFQVFT